MVLDLTPMGANFLGFNGVLLLVVGMFPSTAMRLW
jgi:hypothetical protein